MASSLVVVWIGFSVLIMNIFSKYLSLFSHLVIKVCCPKSKEEMELLVMFNKARQDLSRINMVDEFAKYARAKRSLNKMKDNLTNFGKNRSTTRTKVNFAVQSIYYICYLVFLVSLMWSFRDVPLTKLPTKWLWPVTFAVSFPCGIPGGVGIAFWLFVTNQVSRTITTSFYA